MNKKIVQIFNKQIIEFMQQIFNSFPHLKNNDEILLLHQKLQAAIEFTPLIPIQLFKQHITYVYEIPIDEKDTDFFLNNDKFNSNACKIFKQVLRQASDENKKIMWDYVQRLKLLAKKYEINLKQPKS